MSMEGIYMEKEIVGMLCKNLKWYERVIVRMFKPIFVKTYNMMRMDIVNTCLK